MTDGQLIKLRKRKNRIKKITRHKEINKHNCCFITLVSSITSFTLCLQKEEKAVLVALK